MTRRAKQEWALAAVLFAVTLASRIPLRSRYLANGDSVNFALALEDYDLGPHQPHPPGYILYVALGRLFRLFFSDANTALVAISIIASAAAVAGIYILGRDIFNRRTGLAAAALLLFSPLAWYYGEVALSYSLELPLVIALVWLLYQLLFHRRFLLTTAMVLGIAGGFRQDVLIFLVPFWLAGSLSAGTRPMLKSWAVLALTVLAWLLPLIILAGGLSDFRALSRAQFETGVWPTSMFAQGWVEALALNGMEVWRALLWLLGAAAPALLLLVALLLKPRFFYTSRRVQMLLLLMLLPLLFFFLIHFGQPGYLLVYSAPLFLLVAFALVSLLGVATGSISALRAKGSAHRWTAVVLAGILTLVAIANTALFARAARLDWQVPIADGFVANLFGAYSANGIREGDRQMDATLASVRQAPAGRTDVVSVYPWRTRYTPQWRQLMYYLPEYRVIKLNLDYPGGDMLIANDHKHKTITGWEVLVPPETSTLVFVGLDPDQTDLGLERVAGDVSQTPVTIAEMPATGSIRVNRYTFEHR